MPGIRLANSQKLIRLMTFSSESCINNTDLQLFKGLDQVISNNLRQLTSLSAGIYNPKEENSTFLSNQWKHYECNYICAYTHKGNSWRCWGAPLTDAWNICIYYESNEEIYISKSIFSFQHRDLFLLSVKWSFSMIFLTFLWDNIQFIKTLFVSKTKQRKCRNLQNYTLQYYLWVYISLNVWKRSNY